MRSWQSVHRPASCRTVKRLVQAYLDGEIADGQAWRIADHLDRCRRCGRDANGYRRLKARLSRLSPPLAPRELDRLRTFAEDIA